MAKTHPTLLSPTRQWQMGQGAGVPGLREKVRASKVRQDSTRRPTPQNIGSCAGSARRIFLQRRKEIVLAYPASGAPRLSGTSLLIWKADEMLVEREKTV